MCLITKLDLPDLQNNLFFKSGTELNRNDGLTIKKHRGEMIEFNRILVWTMFIVQIFYTTYILRRYFLF